MKNQTKELKRMMLEDLKKLSAHNNSKDANRTAEQLKQSRLNKADHYITKWLSITPETDAQREYIDRVVTAALKLTETVV